MIQLLLVVALSSCFQFSDTHGTDMARLRPPAGKLFGTGVGGATDLNGDGIPDVVVTVESDKGHAAQYSGFNGAFIMMQDQLAPNGPGIAAWTQLSIATMGDFNNDGIEDFVMGVPEREDFLGDIPSQVVVYSGAGGKLLHLQFLFAQPTGYAVSSIGDINADGRDDLFLSGDAGGSPLFPNNAEVRLAPSGAVRYIKSGTGINDGFGASLAGVGDVNLDGFPDFAAGAPFGNYVRVFSGRSGSLLYQISGTGLFSTSLASSGDYDGDGRNDILVGAPSDTAGGSISIYSGATGLLAGKRFGAGSGENYGAAVAFIGDLNQDGMAEFAVGAPLHDAPGINNAGSVSIHRGGTAAPITYVAGDGVNFRIGTALSRAGDINQDNLPDLLILSPGGEDLPGLSPKGHVRLMSFAPGLVQFTASNGTQGCDGIQNVNLKSPPALAVTPMVVTTPAAPPASVGLLLITNVANQAGADPFGVGVIIYPDLFNATESYIGDMVSDTSGFGIGLVPVVNNPLFIGVDFYLQTLWYWGSGPCVPSTNLLASSQLLRLKFQS